MENAQLSLDVLDSPLDGDRGQLGSFRKQQGDRTLDLAVSTLVRCLDRERDATFGLEFLIGDPDESGSDRCPVTIEYDYTKRRNKSVLFHDVPPEGCAGHYETTRSTGAGMSLRGGTTGSFKADDIRRVRVVEAPVGKLAALVVFGVNDDGTVNEDWEDMRGMIKLLLDL